MLRAAFRSKALPLRASNRGTTQFDILITAWQRLFSSQPVGKAHGNMRWGRSSPVMGLRGISQYSTMPRSSFGQAHKFLRDLHTRGFKFSAWRRNTSQGAQKSLSLSERLKKLSREYGWSAVGVYLGLSVLDFPFCFLLVRVVGTDRIGQIEHYVVSTVSSFIPESVRSKASEWWKSIKKAETKELGDHEISGTVEMVGWGVEEAQVRHKEEASLATQLALAYAIHKSFIFIRVPLTAAVTPKVVKILRGWGWNIGKRTVR